MAVKLVAIIGLLSLSLVHGLQVNSDGKIKLKVVTTAGCSDVANFIRNQLSEAYRLYANFLDLEIVPWGKATWDEVGEISCQFGTNDCWANRVQRCVLDMLKENQEAQMHYLRCEFTTPFPSFVQGSYLCAQAVGVNLINLDHCVANNHDDLDRTAQEAAAPVIEAFDFVPAIVFNDSIDRELHETALKRLTSMICFALASDPNSGVTACQI